MKDLRADVSDNDLNVAQDGTVQRVCAEAPHYKGQKGPQRRRHSVKSLKKGEEVLVSELPKCDLCKQKDARYDFATPHGSVGERMRGLLEGVPRRAWAWRGDRPAARARDRQVRP